MVAFGLAQAGTSLALDICILLLPIPFIRNLHLQRRRKVAVAVIFWLGGFCCIAAIVRLALLREVLSTTVTSAEDGYNLLCESGYPSFNVVYIISESDVVVRPVIQSKAYIFTVIEPNFSIIAACLPCYGNLVQRLGGRTLESVVRSVRSEVSLRSRVSFDRSSDSRSKTLRAESSGTVAKDSIGIL